MGKFCYQQVQNAKMVRQSIPSLSFPFEIMVLEEKFSCQHQVEDGLAPSLVCRWRGLAVNALSAVQVSSIFKGHRSAWSPIFRRCSVSPIKNIVVEGTPVNALSQLETIFRKEGFTMKIAYLAAYLIQIFIWCHKSITVAYKKVKSNAVAYF